MPDGSVIMHGALPYDPAKAHEYYLKTRDLKGRTAGAAQPATVGRPNVKIQTASVPKGPVVAQKNVAQKNAAIVARMASLNKKLSALRKILADLQKQLKALSGSKTTAKATATGSAKSGSPQKISKPTLQDKAKAARASKDYYNKHKNDKPKADDAKAIQAKIDNIKSQIKKLREEIANAHKPAVPVGAGKQTNK